MDGALRFRKSEHFSKIMPAWSCKCHTDAYHLCVLESAREKRVSILQTALTRGFATRGQTDVIYHSSIPDFKFKYFLTCRDHGIKISQLTPLTSKNMMGVDISML